MMHFKCNGGIFCIFAELLNFSGKAFYPASQMITYFELEEDDFLRYQLYMASLAPGLKKMRLRKRITFPVVFLFFGILLLLAPTPAVTSFACWIFAVLWWLFYPFWDKELFRKRYRKFVQENYGYRFGKKVSVEITEGKITGNDNGYEINVKPKDVETVIFIPALIMIKISDNRLMLIPAERISESERFIEALADFSDKWNIPLQREPGWVWK